MPNYPLLSLAGAPTDGVDEVQRITPGGTISGGTFTITYDGQTTDPIDWDASLADITAALEDLSNIDAGEVMLSGGPIATAAVDLTFALNKGGLNLPQITVNAAGLTGTNPTLTPSTVTAGVTGSYRGAQPGAYLADTTNAILYRNTGTRATPVWEVPAAEPVWVLTP